jgi:hypothetical protein
MPGARFSKLKRPSRSTAFSNCSSKILTFAGEMSVPFAELEILPESWPVCDIMGRDTESMKSERRICFILLKFESTKQQQKFNKKV